MTSYLGMEPGLGGDRRPRAFSGAEPQLGGDRRLDLTILDMLSRGLWASSEELSRVARLIPPEQRSTYCKALLARLDIADPEARLPEVAPWRGGRDQRVRIIDSLGVLGDVSVCSTLTRLINDPNAEVRHSAMAALGRLGDRQAIPMLLHVLSQTERSTQDRIAAAEALAAIGSPETAPGLIACLDCEANPIVQRRIVFALGCVGGEQAVPALTSALEHSANAGVREEAVYALSRIGGAAALVALWEALNDSSAQVRYACVQSIQRFEGKVALAALAYALSDPDERVRNAARAARSHLPRL